MTMVEEIGSAMYARARLDPKRPPRRGAVEVALSLHGRDVLERPANLVAEATVGWLRGGLRIAIRRSTSTPRAHYLLAQMLARAELMSRGLVSVEDERAIAAWLVAPPPAFAACFGQVGLDLPALAASFSVPETCAALRIPEVGGPDAVVTTPLTVYRKGRRFAWASDEELRALAATSKPRSVRKVRVRDEPGRVALVAKTA